MGFQKVEFEFPDEVESKVEIEPTSAIEVDVGGTGKNTQGKDIQKPVEQEVELEIVDDTPEEDQDRRPTGPTAEVTEDELKNYSGKVQHRIKSLGKKYNDERRAKEEATRERQELERVTQQLMAENKSLKETGNKSQEALIHQAKKNANAEHEVAKVAYKKAYEDGDADKVLEAQELLSASRIKIEKVNNYRVTPLQETKSSVEITPEPQTPVPVKDERAEQWVTENDWFNTDVEMTSLALGLHNKLVGDGVDPKSDDYYERIDGRMREVFPDRFDSQEEKVKVTKSSNVVAPATRSTTPKKIRLTQTQVRLAKRLGITPEQYAKQVALDMRKDA